MFKVSGLLCLVLAIGTGTLLFHTSQSVQNAEQNLMDVRNDVVTEKESLRILSAEWDYLNCPERLEKLTLKNLDMDEPRADKVDFIGGEGDVPEPRIPVLPSLKPESLIRHVSVQRKLAIENGKLEVIENPERKSFDELIDGAEEGE